MTEKKKRKAPYQRRFANLKLGDVLVNRRKDANGEWTQYGTYFVCDTWFDPVAGQDDPITGTMVGIQLLCDRDGRPYGWKQSYPIRALAPAGFFYEGPQLEDQVKNAKPKGGSAADAVFRSRDG